ncbi:MAG: GNAT family N-acetyltransferase [Lachnospiraceae bacterium]|nr:GNAT family N-acetyltransferase [Lachnospiraceae bacterium]
MIIVRNAQRQELERVNEMRRMVNDVHVSGRPDVFRENFCDELRQHIYDKYDACDSDVLVAVADEVVCGFAIVEYIERPQSAYINSRRFYHVKEFGVDEKYRRKGVATALISFMKDDARKMGFHKMELDMWEFNDGALAFYENVGFKTYRRYMEMEC